MITLMISHERSGSHLLGELLWATGAHVYDEVCNAHAVDPKTYPQSFHRFRHDYTLADPDFALAPSLERQVAFDRAYFEHLAALQPDKNVVVDIKYAHIHNFERYWWPVFRRALLFHVCQIADIRVLHLHRVNVLEAAVSAHVSKARQVWHSWQEEAAQRVDDRHELHVATVIEDAQFLVEQTRWIKRCLPGVTAHEITYEALTHMVASGEGVAELAAFVGGAAPESFEPKLQKLGRPLRETVINYDALADACRAAGLGAYL